MCILNAWVISLYAWIWASKIARHMQSKQGKPKTVAGESQLAAVLLVELDWSLAQFSRPDMDQTHSNLSIACPGLLPSAQDPSGLFRTCMASGHAQCFAGCRLTPRDIVLPITNLQFSLQEFKRLMSDHHSSLFMAKERPSGVPYAGHCSHK